MRRFGRCATGVFLASHDACFFSANLAGLALLVARDGDQSQIDLLCRLVLDLAADLSSGGSDAFRDHVDSNIERALTLLDAAAPRRMGTRTRHMESDAGDFVA